MTEAAHNSKPHSATTQSKRFLQRFFPLKVSQLPSLWRLYSGFLFLALFLSSLPFSLSHSHAHTYTSYSKQDPAKPSARIANSQENFHMLLLWAVTMRLCLGFGPPHQFLCFRLMKTGQLLNSPVSASCNPDSGVPDLASCSEIF